MQAVLPELKTTKRPTIRRVSKGHPIYDKFAGSGTAAIQQGSSIYILKKNVPDWVIEHEVAHYQLGHTDKDLTINRYFEQEIQANLLCYLRVGQPKRLNEILNFWWDDTRDVVAKEHPEMSKGEIDTGVQESITSQLQNYWHLLPEQWRTDYMEFIKEQKGVALTPLKLQPASRPTNRTKKKPTKRRGSTPALKGVR